MTLAALPEGLSRADGMTGVIIFAVVYAIVSIMAKMKQASQKGAGEGAGDEAEEAAKQQRRTQQRLQPRQQQHRSRQQQGQVRSAPPAPSRPAGSTQSEGARLEDLLRVLTEAAGVPTTTGGPVERQRPVPLPSAEEVEERESLEVEEQIQNLETETRRPTRREVDHDDEAEAIVQRRILAAQERDRSLSRADHQVFDKKIRAVVPDNTRVARPRQASLRQAIIWREILGPPISLRKPSESDF